MDSTSRSEITRILFDLRAHGGAREDATGFLMEAVYAELRRLAAGLLGRERSDHTLQPTALVHEAYLKLVDQSRVEWQGRAHFLAVAAQAMRRILVDHARRRAAGKRGGDWQRVSFVDVAEPAAGPTLGILDLDEALDRLARTSERASRVVELKFFAGMTGKEIAHVLEVSPRTVKSDWATARLWLARELDRAG